MLTDSTPCKCLAACARRVLIVLVLLPVALLTLAACDGEASGGYTPPPATIIRASDTMTPSPTATEKAASPTPPQQVVTPGPTEGYPAPVITPRSAGTPEVYPGK